MLVPFCIHNTKARSCKLTAPCFRIVDASWPESLNAEDPAPSSFPDRV